MIKTDWVPCDKKDCNLVAWIVMEDPLYGIHVNVCGNHYEELKHERDWKISDLQTGDRKQWQD